MILYTSTAFDDENIINGDPTTGNDGYGCSILVDNSGGYQNSTSLTVTSTTRIVGDQLTGGAIEGGTGPYSQVFDSLSFPTIAGEARYGIGFWNTADASLATWLGACSPTNGVETDWAGNPDGSSGMSLHTPNLTDDVYTLIVPTVSPLRQATNTRNGNSIVFHIPQNSLAVYAINANLRANNTITSGMNDTQASEKILAFGYGLILRASGNTTLFNQT